MRDFGTDTCAHVSKRRIWLQGLGTVAYAGTDTAPLQVQSLARIEANLDGLGQN
ncbi:uncharacterized protein BDZ83DRAFT_609984 [Colletotrichum acutatum]|uniref:Uncharacterized protein n=1 Tax=Glomerella acutata TaxID=27357 RepID=A0AAD8URW1_GLOAC|nr:uncharacterized protein BDZ83DRAFT_609984 [Colletotrichum acutatum]KAK1728358.1 hypothetical protein BDZ83DRAFT_609984 [Colletotrichum acutatum]